MIRHTAFVSGTLPFPLDMLRHDACFPTTSQDADAIQESLDRSGDKPIQVQLTASTGTNHWPFTAARWESFGWSCTREPVETNPEVPVQAQGPTSTLGWIRPCTIWTRRNAGPVEVMCFPFEGEAGVSGEAAGEKYVLARVIPHDPTTLAKLPVNSLVEFVRVTSASEDKYNG